MSLPLSSFVMRAFTSFLIASTALLLATLPACATLPVTPGGTSWVVPHFTFEPMSAENQAELRYAIANCAKVEMSIKWYDEVHRTCSDRRWHYVERAQHSGQYSWKRREWVRETKQGSELNAILNKLSAVPQWYTPVFDKLVKYTPCAMYSIRLLNAEGMVLFSEEHNFGPWISCMNDQGERVCFSAFFPDFPDRKCFGK